MSDTTHSTEPTAPPAVDTPEAHPSRLAAIAENVRSIFSGARDAAAEARKKTKAACDSKIEKVNARVRETAACDKEYGRGMRACEKLLADPLVQATPALAGVVESLAAAVHEYRRIVQSVPVHGATLVQNLRTADSDQDLADAEAALTHYVQTQCQRPLRPILERLHAQATEHSERLWRQRESLQRGLPVTVMDHPAKFLELDFTRPRRDVGGPILDFDVFQNGGVQ